MNLNYFLKQQVNLLYNPVDEVPVDKHLDDIAAFLESNNFELDVKIEDANNEIAKIEAPKPFPKTLEDINEVKIAAEGFI